MPHYKDWHGKMSVTEYPDNTGEYWGSFDDSADVTSAATGVEWSTYNSNDEPDALGLNLLDNFWANYNIPHPNAFAIMAQPEYSTPTETNFLVWDVSWGAGSGDISGPRNNTMSLEQLTNGQSNSISPLSSIYFQVDGAWIPEPSTGMLLGIALGIGLLFRSIPRMLGLTSGLLLVFALF